MEGVVMTWQHRNGQRCGWCIAGDHDNCAVAVLMGRRRSFIRDGQRIITALEPYLWVCECKFTVPHPKTRCGLCGRPDVEVTVRSRCKDQIECKAWRNTNGVFTRPDVEQSRPRGRPRCAAWEWLEEILSTHGELPRTKVRAMAQQNGHPWSSVAWVALGLGVVSVPIPGTRKQVLWSLPEESRDDGMETAS